MASRPQRVIQSQYQFIIQHWFRFAQRLSHALLIPIAIMPAAGIMLGLALNPLPFMPESLVLVFKSVGHLIFAMMPLLFAVAISIGFCKDQGLAAFTSVFGFGVYISTLGALSQIYGLPTRPLWGVETIDTGIAGGILVGAMTYFAVKCSTYVKLPAIFSFFEGRRSAPLIVIPFVLMLAGVMSVIWPPLASYIEVLSHWSVYQVPELAFGVYGFVERLLIPLGLHHIWNAPFFLEFGHYWHEGKLVRGEIARYLAGDPRAGHLAGGYLIKMWGLPAAAFAIWRCADKSQKNRVAGIMLSAGMASWLTGVTEPIEFAFMFVAPFLFLLHAIFSGIAYAVCIMLDIHHSIVFSHGLVDFSLLFNRSENTYWFWLLGPATALLYYSVFRLSILAFDLKTPGRVSREFSAEGFQTTESVISDTLMPANQGFSTESVHGIIGALGGRENIVDLHACLTRLRVSVIESTLVDKSSLQHLGAKGVVVVGKGVQVVFGTKAETLRNLLQKYLD